MTQTHSRTKVCYFFDPDVGSYYYGQGHPMKPHRIRMTHNLVLNYGLYQKMEIYRPHRTSKEDMTMFHSDDYINFLASIRPDLMAENSKLMTRFNVGEDCPVFDGLFEFCQLSSGGSVGSAVKLNHGQADIGINWSGGLHHAKKSEASGFCYINDIVLGILELLKHHQRVLYVDVDIHHGDGVEEAFYTTDRVMTVSFHKYGEYFPGTGDLRDFGAEKGKYCSLNFPLRDGIDDFTYESIFKPIMMKVMEQYRPNAIVLQLGADSLTGDRLGCFNLTLKGHGKCVELMKSYGLPMIMLGGGGYTISNVSRCWTYETAIALDTQLSNEMPYNDYFEYFGPDYRLHVSPNNMINYNTRDYLNKISAEILDNLRMLPCAPGIQMQDIPADGIPLRAQENEDEPNPNQRISSRQADRRFACDEEFSDSDDDVGDDCVKPFTSMKEGRKDHRSSETDGKSSPLNKKICTQLVGIDPNLPLFPPKEKPSSLDNALPESKLPVPFEQPKSEAVEGNVEDVESKLEIVEHEPLAENGEKETHRSKIITSEPYILPISTDPVLTVPLTSMCDPDNDFTVPSITSKSMESSGF